MLTLTLQSCLHSVSVIFTLTFLVLWISLTFNSWLYTWINSWTNVLNKLKFWLCQTSWHQVHHESSFHFWGGMNASRSIFGDSFHFFVAICQPYDGATGKKNSVDHPEICEAPSKPAVSGSKWFLCVWWIDVPECVVVHVKQVKSYSGQSAVSLSLQRL